MTDLLPVRLAALEVFLKTGDIHPLRNFLETIPEDYEPKVDEWRACAARILGVEPELVSKRFRFAVKHALYAAAWAQEMDGAENTPNRTTVTTRSALIEILRSLHP